VTTMAKLRGMILGAIIGVLVPSAPELAIQK
jgi:hypothetical protein